MSRAVDDIKEPVAHHMEVFEDKFKSAMKSSVPLLDKITTYIVKRKGKQIRPMFVFLSAQVNGEINDSTHRAASVIELIHTATLVHDDVVDDSNRRRGFFSINALWKNKIAVLVGDYLLSKGLLLSLNNNDHKVLTILSEAVRLMSEGELLQIEKARNLNLSETIYYSIIQGKTASLLSSACGAGASTTFNDNRNIEKMQQFGEKVGMAFQIKDDLFDYSDKNIGKPTGIDIKEKKLTLPLIYTLSNCQKDLRRKIIYIIKNENRNAEKVKFVIDAVKTAGGIEYATAKMLSFRDEALQLL